MAARRARSRPFLAAVSLVVFFFGGLSSPAAPARATPGVAFDACALSLPAFNAATSRECLVCHARVGHGGHAYDVDYPRASATRGMVLRPLTEVTHRGVPVPEGRITCVTCHDRASPWRFHLRVPPGATLTHAVDPARVETYDPVRIRPHVRPGDDVGRKPLCLGCHALD